MPPATENESVPTKSAAASLSAATPIALPSCSGIATTELPNAVVMVTSAPIPRVTSVGIPASLSQSIEPANASASRVNLTSVSVPSAGSNSESGAIAVKASGTPTGPNALLKLIVAA